MDRTIDLCRSNHTVSRKISHINLGFHAKSLDSSEERLVGDSIQKHRVESVSWPYHLSPTKPARSFWGADCLRGKFCEIYIAMLLE
jgi:hypothetical protein